MPSMVLASKPHEKTLVRTEQGRFVWNWVLQQITYVPKGARRAVTTWTLTQNEAMFETKAIRKIGRILANSDGEF